MVDAGKVLNQKRNHNPFYLKWRGPFIFGFVKWDPSHMLPHKSIVACSEGYIVSIFIIFDIFDMHIV